MAATLKTTTAVLALGALLAGCAEKELVLEGHRQVPREAVIGGEAVVTEDAAPLGAGAAPVAIALPGQSGGDWTQVGGNASHSGGNAAYSGALSPVWSAKVGSGDSRKNRITAAPVVAGGRIFTLDAEEHVTATGTNGGVAWQVDLTPAGERAGDAAGGGLAFADGRLFVTTGFGELLALDPATGAVAWRQRFESPVAGAPAAAGGKVFAVARDGSAWAVDAANGKVAWQVPGSSARAGIVDGSAPAVSGGTVVFPFATGQLLAIDIAEGTPKWQGYVAGKRVGRAYASYSDLTGDPVIAGGTLVAGSAAGRLGAIDMETGTTLWSAPDGATGATVVAGGSVFFVNDEDQLVRLEASSGAEVWRVDLPYFTKDKDKKRRAIFAHHGPVLAGGRLITASTDGLIRAFDPASGKVVATAEIPGGAASGPVVAGGTLYVLSKSGTLHAFR
ncbi:PQQ-binding-like beta-propeller repeat protein [Frigidibacter sp. RF13]|uniref:outer membrane protein assembly factor BamB family protein n=1 Tax=Frigidibacter sp. RF13 TaxID=2997340 RepID=UPI00226D81B3|nr:PQQ-binding-like beta-propeller repeat protein [Frigidibacter sp. RF13]MCY1127106.1 PQQ-binding-like beta-propeller repeat protein [Frigidibacter sp. RF13]